MLDAFGPASDVYNFVIPACPESVFIQAIKLPGLPACQLVGLIACQLGSLLAYRKIMYTQIGTFLQQVQTFSDSQSNFPTVK